MALVFRQTNLVSPAIKEKFEKASFFKKNSFTEKTSNKVKSPQLNNFVRTSIKLNDSKNEAREQIQKHYDKKQFRAI